jgi:hypothetical protein
MFRHTVIALSLDALVALVALVALDDDCMIYFISHALNDPGFI